MKNKILSIILATIMIVASIPPVFADGGDTFYAVDVRTHSLDNTMAVSDVEIFVKASNHIHYKTFFETNDIAETHKWYSVYYMESEIPDEEKTLYATVVLPSEIALYVREMPENEKFSADRDYLCKVTLTASNGSVFNDDCIVSAIEPDYEVVSPTELAVWLPYVCDASPASMENIGVTYKSWDQYWKRITIEFNSNTSKYKYYYRWTDCSNNEVLLGNSLDATPGEYVITRDNFNPLSVGGEQCNVTLEDRKPCLQIIKILSMDESNPAFAVYGYAFFALPMLNPYISTETIVLGEPIDVLSLTGTFGNYSENIASVNFVGWFADEACTTAWTSGDGYAKFSIYISCGMFGDGYCEATLSDGVAELVPVSKTKTSDTQFTCVYKISENSGYSSIATSGGTGGETAVFAGNEKTQAMLEPDAEGNIVASILYAFPQTVYLSKVLIDGVEYTGNDAHGTPLFERTQWYEHSNNVPRILDLPLEKPDSKITLCFSMCDIITISYNHDDPIRFITTDNGANESETYYVPETQRMRLFFRNAYIRDMSLDNETEIVLDPYCFNTAEDRTGIDVVFESGWLMWYPQGEYVNGQCDNINLYIVWTCRAHRDDEDADFWVYHDAHASACGQAGNIAYRQCKHCNRYEILVNNKYVDAKPEDIFLDAIDHNYEYTENGDGTHTAECSRCHNKFTEDCEYGSYTDNHDGTHSAYCAKCNYRLIESHHYENGVCKECGCNEPAPTYIPGDMDGDGEVTAADAEYLLYYTIFGEEDYPINQPADFTNDGSIDAADAEYLLYYTIFGEEDYPLNASDDVVLPYVPLP